MTKKSIEDLFKDSFENFEAEVKPGVWSNIKTGLAGVGLGFLGKSIISKIGTNWIIAIASSVVTVATTLAVMHWSAGSGKNANLHATNQPIVKSENSLQSELKNDSNIPVLEIKNQNSKPEETTTTVQPMQETKVKINSFGNSEDQQKEAQKVINDFSGVPIASIFASQNSGTVPLIVNFSNTGVGKTNKWSFSDNNKIEKSANPVHVFEVPGKYTVTLNSIDAAGNVATEKIKIDARGNTSMSGVPFELTPNGDGDHDFFGFNTKNTVRISAQIFDKKGNLIIEYNKLGSKWDGKDNKGMEVKDGYYIFVANAEGINDGKNYESKGIINLRR